MLTKLRHFTTALFMFYKFCRYFEYFMLLLLIAFTLDTSMGLTLILQPHTLHTASFNVTEYASAKDVSLQYCLTSFQFAHFIFRRNASQ